MEKKLDNPIFWRGINTLIQTIGLLFGIVVGAYITINGIPIQTMSGHEIEVSSPLLRIIYNGQAPGIAIILISILGLIWSIKKGKAELRKKTKDGQSIAYLELLGKTLDHKVTSRMLYETTINRLGINPNIRFNDEQLHEIAAKYKKSHPELSEQELYERYKQINNEYDPSETLLPLLNDILANIPAKYKLELPDAFAGEIPLREINASISSPTGGLLIVLNKGLTISFNEWAKIVVNLVAIDSKSDLEADSTKEDLLSRLKKSIQGYIERETIPFFPELATDEKSTLCALLALSAQEFVIAHECAHKILGHLELPLTKDKNEAISREIDADKVAAEVFLNGVPLDPDWEPKERLLDIQFRLSGMIYSLTMFHIMETFHTPFRKEKSTYPNAYLRLGKIIEFIQNLIGNRKYPIFNDISKVLDDIIPYCTVKKPNVSSMPDNVKLLFEFYTKYRSSQIKDMDQIASKKSNDLLQWVPSLLDASYEIASGPYRDRGFDWSDGDMLNSYELFNLTCEINDALCRLWGSAGERTMYESGNTIADALERAATDLEEKGILQGSTQKRKEAQSIRKLIIERYSKYKS